MEAKRYPYPPSHRIRTRPEFSAVFDARTRESRGPVTVYALPNALGHPRLGISMSRKVGIAARRNRIKRLLREAFRHHQYDWPRGYDIVIVPRPHAPFILAEYHKLLTALMLRLHHVWQRRAQPGDSPP